MLWKIATAVQRTFCLLTFILFSFRQVKPFLKGQNGRVGDPAVRKAVQQAEEALSLSLEQRKSLVNCLASDEEDDNDDDEDCDQTMPSEDESPSKVKSRQKRKNSGNNSRKDESDDEDDDEVTGKKVVKKVFWNRPCRRLARESY